MKNNHMPDQAKTPPTAALYITCLANSLRPEIGHACVQLVESLGFKVDVPLDQTCCGQPGYNAGHRDQAIAVAKTQITALQEYDWVVVPSGSCAGMIINHYPRLFAQDTPWLEQAIQLAARTRELCQFLDEQGWQPGTPSKNHTQQTWAYHTSCSCRRETHSHQHGHRLLLKAGIRLAHLHDQEVCCGFGGTFAAKFDPLSSRMGQKKLAAVEQCSASGVTSADLGCLLQLQSLDRSGLSFCHIAELLAGTCAGEHKP